MHVRERRRFIRLGLLVGAASIAVLAGTAFLRSRVPLPAGCYTEFSGIWAPLHPTPRLDGVLARSKKLNQRTEIRFLRRNRVACDRLIATGRLTDSVLASAYLTRASIRNRLSGAEAALRDARSAVESAPRYARAHRAVAGYLSDTERHVEAVRTLRRLYSWYPEPDVAAAVAYEYREIASSRYDMRLYGQSFGWAKRATQLDPEYAYGWLLLGSAAYRLGLRDRAGEAFDQALELSPGILDLHSVERHEWEQVTPGI